MKDKHVIFGISLYITIIVWFTCFQYDNTSPDLFPPNPTLKSIPTDTISIIEYYDRPLIEAIIYVESRGNDSAYNKQSGATGCMQIMPIMVKEVNRINKIRNSDQKYTLEDRWDRNKSIEMFLIWKDFHHKNSDYEVISRHWWGGPKYGKEECSIFYWERVKENLEFL
jgi:hypothetical protein